MSFLAVTSSSTGQPLLRRGAPALPLTPRNILSFPRNGNEVLIAVCKAARKDSAKAEQDGLVAKGSKGLARMEEEVWEEVEEDVPWIQDKAMDLVEFTGSVTQAIPGPRVGQSSLPWLLAIPLVYAGASFVIAVVKTFQKFSSPKNTRRKLVSKNALVCKSIDEMLQKEDDGSQFSELEDLVKQTGFSMEDIVRKYVRYALNEKPFIPELVASLIHLRKASMLPDSSIADILNEISSRIVMENGPVVMNMSGYTERGFKRKLAVQILFGKLFYLSELPEFCSGDNSLIIKEIFGVTDEDTDQLRLHTLSDAGEVESLEKLVDSSDLEEKR